MLVSVVISTYNRAQALAPTLDALAHQDLPADAYEVLVIDDGSTDPTAETLASVSQPYRLRTFRLPVNSGVSAGRNVGLREAEGDYIVMISDDLIVPPDFLSRHVQTHQRFSDAWVVGGFRQLESSTETSFGRYLDGLERAFDRGRTGQLVDSEIYEMTVPTARNMSLPRSDLDRVGLFDEQFRVTCEDQDLALRARPHGIRFLYDASLECLHNDQAADLKRYCRFQQRGARDGVRLFAKYPGTYGDSPLPKLNGYVERSDPPGLVVRKLVKRLAAITPVTTLIERLVWLAERVGASDRLLHPAYRSLIGIYTFRGWREGLVEEGSQSAPASPRPLEVTR
jgi:GT2 family glycosyltransferase